MSQKLQKLSINTLLHNYTFILFTSAKLSKLHCSKV